ncbi:MAG: BrnT family toxin [Acidobacteriaceae bacterium]
MPEEFDGFDWDAANVGHIMRHQVAPSEVEEVAGLPHLTIAGKAVGEENRWQLFGKTAADRYLVVIFTIRRKLFRTVTAYPMNAAERKKYGPQIR